MRAPLAALALLALAPLPAGAVEMHRPIGSISVDTHYDDHVSGRSAPEVELYPAGNSDWRGGLSLGLGTEFSHGDRWNLYLGARLKGYRYVNYPDFSGLAGSATAELSGYGLPLGLDAFLSYGFSSAGTESRSHTAALSLERPLGRQLTLILAGGQYWHVSTADGLSNRGPFGDGGVRMTFPTRTSLTALVSVMGQRFDYGRDDQILSASLSLSQRLWKGTYLRAGYRRDLATSNEPGRSFPGNALSLGTSYYF
jgi:hypothetical protein